MLFQTGQVVRNSEDDFASSFRYLGLTDTPADLQTGASYSFNLSYIKPVSDKLTVTPLFRFPKCPTRKIPIAARPSVTYVLGLSTSYAINDWLNLSGAANYTAKDGNRADVIEFRDFTSGFTLAVNHSF